MARGGKSTVANLRLRCRGHNQFTAEQSFGAGFMREKREEARRRAAERRSQRAAVAAIEDAPVNLPETNAARVSTPAADLVPLAESSAPTEPGREPEPDPETDVMPWLRALGYSASRARWAAAQCVGRPGASLEDRVRFALRLLAPPHRKIAPKGAAI